MNYYNPYNNYNNYSMPYAPPSQNYPQQPPQQQAQFINGKIVDSIDVVRATEVPLGSFGVFPKADMTEVYIKTWNNNGTTQIIAYKPIELQQQKEEPKIEMKELLDRIISVETKIDSLL